MKRLAAALALSLTLAAYGAVIASQRQETRVKQPSACQEDESCWNCESMGNFRCGPNPDLEDKR